MKSEDDRTVVLIIDDDPDFQTMIGAMGQIWNLPMLHASNCAQGLRLLEHEHRRIKIILLDYFMPGMEPGVCAASILAKAGADIPVVLLTAAADAARRASELKLNRWLSKPFEWSDLEALLMHP